MKLYPVTRGVDALHSRENVMATQQRAFSNKSWN